MPNFVLRATSQRLIAGAFSAVMLVGPAMGQEGTAVPDFSPNSRTGWIAGVPDGVSPIGQDFLQPPSGPGPVTFDKAHPSPSKTRPAGTGPTSMTAKNAPAIRRCDVALNTKLDIGICSPSDVRRRQSGAEAVFEEHGHRVRESG